MQKINNIVKIFAVLFVFVLLLTGCSDTNDNGPTGSNPPASEPVTPPPSAPSASAQRPTRPITTTVTLADNNIAVSGNGATASGNTLTISADGVYEITGTLSDGQIVIDAPDVAVVELVLSGINISNSKNATIWCKNCDDFLISLTENTQNIITDASNYTYGDTVNQEPSAAIFSKTDLNIGGTGWLTVNANFNHGIYSKDDLVIEGGGFKVTSAVDAIRGKDSLNILNGRFEINAGGDAFQASSTDGAEFGYLQITGGDFVIKACGDAIQAETALTVSGGTFDITTEGSVLSVRDQNGNVLLELTTRSDAVQSVYTTPEFKVGETYSLYIDGEKKIDITLKEGMNAIGDDGGKFTGGYSRGNMADFRN